MVTTGGLSLRVERLEGAGLVTRTRDATDARIRYVEMTAQGRGLEVLPARPESSARAARPDPDITGATDRTS